MIQEPHTSQTHLSGSYEYLTSINAATTKPTPIQTARPKPRPRPQPLRIATSSVIPIQLKANQRLLLITTVPARSPQTQHLRPTIASKQVQSVPFLPRSEPITPSVKKNSLTKRNSNQEQQFALNQELTNNRLNSTNIPNAVKPLLTPTTLTGIAFHADRLESAVGQASVVAQPPTLASMAGIQLTGADASQPGMSGAMPTATVEEMYVPVFIDEYLQQTASAPATNFNSDNNYTNSNSNSSNNGDDICIEDETYETFEFDIDMIADSIQKEEEQQLQQELQQQQEQHHQQQIYICDTNNISIDASSNMGIHFINSDNKNDNSDENSNDSPLNFWNDNCSEEHLRFLNTLDFDENMLENPDFHEHIDNERAIDINFLTNETFKDLFINSQRNPILGEASSNCSVNNSQTLFATAEPIVPGYDENNYNEEYWKLHSNGASQNMDDMLGTVVKTELGETVIAEVMPIELNRSIRSLKRDGSRLRTTSSNQGSQDRKRLRLNLSKMGCVKTEGVLRTPDVVDLILNGTEANMQIMPNQNMILHNLIDFDTHDCGETDSWISRPDSDNVDDELPYTPRSCTSSHTNQTGLTGDYLSNTAPNSPALSTTSTATRSTAARSSRRKGKRGRPAKKHSDQPDPMLLETLTEAERKRMQDRAKNNEASRQSRLKNKEREEAKIEEEKALRRTNAILTKALLQLNIEEFKLKRAVKRISVGK